LGATPRGFCWLESGELLIGTDAGLLRMDKQFQIAAATRQEPVGRVTVDAAGKFAVVSSLQFQLAPSSRKAEFGFHILRLPTLELVRTIFIPGHQLTKAVLSPDGLHVAFDAGVVGAYRHYIVVVEVETGREVARRKNGWTFPNVLMFAPDNSTLLIAKSAITPREPIELWPIPKG
jgi:hypothetical protein